MSKLLMDTKQLYYDFMLYDEENGDYFVNNPKAESSYQLTVAEKHFIKRYMSLVMNTGIISESTKEVIRYNAITSIRQVVKSVVSFNNRNKRNKELNENTVLAMVQYDSKKLLKYFDDDMLEKIRTSTYKDISVYEEQLNLAIAKYGKSSELKEHLALDVPLTEICGKLSDSDFNILLNIIKPYSKGVMRQLIEAIPGNMKAYLNFLLYVNERSQLDEERYAKLKKILIDGLEPEELGAMQKRLSNQANEEVSIEAELLEKPMVERTEADITKEKSIEIVEKSETKSEPEKEFVPDFSEEENDEMIDFSTKSVDSSVAKKNKSNEEQQPVDKKPVEKKPDIYQKTWQTEYGKTNRLQF